MRFVALPVVLWLTVLGAGEAGAQPLRFKLATIAPADSPWHAALREFQSIIDKKSDGKLKVSLFMGGKIGSESEMVNQVKFGSTECVGVSTGSFSSLIEGLDVFELPFLWDNPKQPEVALRLLLPYFDKKFEAQGLHLIGWSENGWRNFMSDGKTIETPDDLAGMKMRSQENALHVAFWQSLGAKPVPLATTDFQRGMKSGMIHGGDNSVVLTAAFGWMDDIKTFTRSRHIYQPAVVVCNNAWFRKLPAEHQQLIDTEMIQIEKSVRRRLDEAEAEFIELFKARGIKVVELSPAARKAFAAKTAPVREKYAASIPPEVLALVKKAKEN